MKSMNSVRSIRVLLVTGALMIVPALQARTCGGTGDVIGSFGWVGMRSVAFVAVPVTPPGTASTTTTTTTTTATTTSPSTPVVGSATAIGGLVAGSLNPAPFASVGRLYLDGNGGVFASAAPGGAVVQTGSYTVNTDCTIGATLTDAFAPTSGGAAGLTPLVQPSATFEGVMVQTGNEIDLTETGAVAGTTITLKKTKQNCSVADVFSAFGISASGVIAGTSSTTVTNAGSNNTSTPSTSFSILGRFVSDGNGNLYVDNIGATSPLTKRKISGTYNVNTDCTGTITLITSDGTKRGANFVEVTAGPNLSNAPPALELAFTDTGVVGSGFAQQQ
jgi:hypothetical protein